MNKKHKLRIIFIVLLLAWGGLSYALAPTVSPIIEPLLQKGSGIQVIKQLDIDNAPTRSVTSFSSTIHPILDARGTTRSEAEFDGEPNSLFLVGQNSNLGGKVFIGENDPYYADYVSTGVADQQDFSENTSDSIFRTFTVGVFPTARTFQQAPQKLNVAGDLVITSLANTSTTQQAVCKNRDGVFVLCP